MVFSDAEVDKPRLTPVAACTCAGRAVYQVIQHGLGYSGGGLEFN